jgi:hypothetical protein
MSRHGSAQPPPTTPEPSADDLILEGAPPGSGRPSWLGLAIAVVIALAAGAALGYGVATPTRSPASSPSPSPSPPAPTAFAASPCELLAAVPYTQLPIFASATVAAAGTSAVPGMRSCEVFDPSTMQQFATVLVRQLPTSPSDFTVVADEIFQGDDVRPASFGAGPGLLVPCSHFWIACHPAAAFVQGPYFLVIALEPGTGSSDTVSSLATGLVALGIGSGQPGPVPSTTASPPAPSFTTAAPPAADATWSGLQWQKLSPDAALASVGYTLRWSGGFIAVGRRSATTEPARTPVWVSADGISWQALDPSVFGSSTFVVGVAEGAGGLVALTAQAGTNDCAPSGDCWTMNEPIQAWTSPNGTTWTAYPGPGLSLRVGAGSPVLVAGPAGLMAAVPDLAGPGGAGSTEAAISADGVTWQTLGAGAFPAGFRITDLYGTPTGYLAVGAQEVDPEHEDAAALWSTDGQHWAVTGPMQIASRTGMQLVATTPSWTAGSVVAGRSGFIVTGGVEGVPSQQLWWQSSDGKHWQALSGYPPLGGWPPEGEGAGSQPHGVLLGDGQRMIACRGGPEAAAWTSGDGTTWTKLTMSGDIPSEGATTAVLLPGGILLSDGTTTWYGQATAR